MYPRHALFMRRITKISFPILLRITVTTCLWVIFIYGIDIINTTIIITIKSDINDT